MYNKGMDFDKIEIQKQWDTDPCGASTVSSLVQGTLEYYRAVRDYRYRVYEKAIQEIYRVLKPHGEAWIGLYHSSSWFFTLSVFLENGILKAKFFRKGWRKTLSKIEYRQNNESSNPLENVYTKKKVLALCQEFKEPTVSVYHVESSHFSKLQKIIDKVVSQTWLEKHLSFGGWYLIIHCKK